MEQFVFSPKLFDINNFQDAQVKVWVNKYGAEINLSVMLFSWNNYPQNCERITPGPLLL